MDLAPPQAAELTGHPLPTGRKPMLATLTVEDFLPHVGKPFEVGEPGRAQPLQLLSASLLGNPLPAARQGFALLFRGTTAPRLPQGTHRVLHPSCGELGLFLVAVGSDDAGQRYEAIFN